MISAESGNPRALFCQIPSKPGISGRLQLTTFKPVPTLLQIVLLESDPPALFGLIWGVPLPSDQSQLSVLIP